MDVQYLLLLLLSPFVITAKVIEVDVLILGGGMSGITAANYFYNEGLNNFLVLEAQDYVGGRLKNLSFGGLTLGEGANWIHYVEEGDENPILQISKKVNLTASLENRTNVAIKNLPNGYLAYTKANKAMEEAANKIIKDNEENKLICKDKPASDAFVEKGWDPKTSLEKNVEWFAYDFEYGVKTKNISARQFTGEPKKNSFVTSKKGYASVTKYLIANFTDKIKTNKIVKEIKYSSNGVEVKTKDGDTYRSNYSLCTFSTGVLATDLVKFVPKLPSWKTEAIKSLPQAFYTHVMARFSEVFWEDAEYLIEGGENRGKYPVIYNMNNKKFFPGSKFLYTAAIGKDASRIENQPENVTINELMETLQIMYPNKNISRPTEFFVSKWSKNPYVIGSYSYPKIGTTIAHFHNLEGRLNNLFFAGEACDFDYWGYLQASYLSGTRQAKAILSCFQGNTCEEYKAESTKESCPSSVHILRSQIMAHFLVLLIVFFNLV